MAHILKISKNDPIIHLKAYGGLKIEGVDQVEVQCKIDAPQLATLVEENGHVYLTANASCSVTVPKDARIEIEKGMGSVSIANNTNTIRVEKAFGNLVLLNINNASIEKVGGNFSVKNAAGAVSAGKVGGNVAGEALGSFSCEKIGGMCVAKDVKGDFMIDKVGGSFKGQSLQGKTSVRRVGADFKASGLNLIDDVKAGGSIHLTRFDLLGNLDFSAGADIHLTIDETFAGAHLDIHSGAHRIRIQTATDKIEVSEKEYDYQLGESRNELLVSADGKVTIDRAVGEHEEIVGDISPSFSYEESAFSELIQERVDTATRRAEAKVRATEVRLEKIKEQVEKHRGFSLDLDWHDAVPPPSPPIPSVTRQAGKKGPSDEERLMILKMLQDKKISVDEAETLFKALEN